VLVTRAARLLACVLALVACGPIGPLPGGPLWGDIETEPVESWDFAARYRQIQLETRPESPYSVNVWLLVHDGRLYVPAGKPAGKRWVRNVLEDERVRLRVARKLYLARALRVSDPQERRALIDAYMDKYNVPDPDAPETPREVWFFRIDPRGT
jgi:hypothetical protein